MPTETGLLDHSEVYIFVAGLRIKNRSNGTYLTVAPVNDETIAEEGTDRGTVLVKIASGLWTATLSVMPNSREVDFLWGIAQTHRNTPGGFAFPFVFRHKRTNMLSATAVIARVPDTSRSRNSVDPSTWTFILPDYDGLMGGFTLNSNQPLPANVAALLNP